MGLDDKIQNEATDAKGKVKESAGSATGNESLESEGRADQGEAKAKEAGRHVKVAAQNVKDTFKS
ncbi:MAG TPA: CsbD family protein [Nocardioides sp.]|nr:CsbD family protein [Nocardioides sp.]